MHLLPVFPEIPIIQITSSHPIKKNNPQCISLEEYVYWSSDKVYIKNEVFWPWCQTQYNGLWHKKGKVRSQGQGQSLGKVTIKPTIGCFRVSLQEQGCKGVSSGRTGGLWPTGMKSQKAQLKDHDRKSVMSPHLKGEAFHSLAAAILWTSGRHPLTLAPGMRLPTSQHQWNTGKWVEVNDLSRSVKNLCLFWKNLFLAES